MQALRETIYSFKAKWFDPQAQLHRPYHVRYFHDSHDIEIFDTKSNRLFLKKSSCPDVIKSTDFYLGAKVLLYGRHFELHEYLDPFTANKLGNQQQKSILLVKGSMVLRIGTILDQLIIHKFSLSAIKMMQLSALNAQKYLVEITSGSNINDVKDLSSSPIVVIEVLGEQCIEKLQKVTKQLISRLAKDVKEEGLIEAAKTVLDAEKQREFFYTTAGHGQTATFHDCTCCIILPHAIKQGHAGKLVESIQSHGNFKITAMEMFTLDRTLASEFLEVYEGVIPHFHKTVDHYTTGPCLVMEVKWIREQSENIVTAFRAFAGPWDVEMAKELQPMTLRARYGLDRVQNAIHCTDLIEDATHESEYFFDILSSRQF